MNDSVTAPANVVLLLRRFCESGDAEAFAHITRQYAGMVYGTCLRVTGNAHHATDAAQETFFHLLKHADRISGSLGCWLHQVATRRSIDLIRRDASRRQREQDFTTLTLVDTDNWGEVSPLVDEAMEELAEDQRQLLVRHFLQGESMVEIAAACGVSQPTISRRVQETLIELREKLRVKGVLVGTVALGGLMTNAAHAAPASVLAELGNMSLAAAGASAPVATVGAVGAFKLKLALATIVTVAGLSAIVVAQRKTSVPSSTLPGAGLPGLRMAMAVGHQRLTFTEHHPLNKLDEVVRRLDIDFKSMVAADVVNAKQDYNLADQSFEVFVPPAYRPEVPHGLFVWVGVTPVSPDWFTVLGRHQLISVTAIPVDGAVGFSRVRLPLDAVHNMKARYRIDEKRIYISGFSAGAGAASHLVCGFPEVFSGGYFLMGGNFCVAHKTVSGSYEPTLQRQAPEWKGSWDQIRKDLRIVLMRAEGDTTYNPQEEQAQFTGLLLDGFERVSYIVLPSGGHQPPNAPSFERGLMALASPPRAALVTTPTDQPNPLPGQVAQAQRLLATALLNLERQYSTQYGQEQLKRLRKSAQDRARRYLQQAITDYPTTPAAAKARLLLTTLAAGNMDKPFGAGVLRAPPSDTDTRP